MDQKNIWIILFRKMDYVVRKFMEGFGIKLYHVLLTGAKKFPEDDAYKIYYK